MTPKFKAVHWLGWLIICLSIFMGGRIAWAAAPAPVPSATVPSGTLDQFIGESFTIPSTSTAPISDQVCFDNTGNATGYQPAFELITPAGVTFNSATYLGLSLIHI